MTRIERVWLRLWIARDLAGLLAADADQHVAYAALIDALAKSAAGRIKGLLLLSAHEQMQRLDCKQEAPSVVDLLSKSEQRSDEWLQQPGERSFNDEMNGISPEDRQRMDADMSTAQLGYKPYKCPNCGWVHAAISMHDVPRDQDFDRYLRCFNCGVLALGFVPAEAGDAPDGCTLPPVVVPGAWEWFLT